MIRERWADAGRLVRRARQRYRFRQALRAVMRVVGAVLLCLVALAFAAWTLLLAAGAGR